MRYRLFILPLFETKGYKMMDVYPHKITKNQNFAAFEENYRNQSINRNPNPQKYINL